MHRVLDGLNFIISFCHSSSKVWASAEKQSVLFVFNECKQNRKTQVMKIRFSEQCFLNCWFMTLHMACKLRLRDL